MCRGTQESVLVDLCFLFEVNSLSTFRDPSVRKLICPIIDCLLYMVHVCVIRMFVSVVCVCVCVCVFSMNVSNQFSPISFFRNHSKMDPCFLNWRFTKGWLKKKKVSQ